MRPGTSRRRSLVPSPLPATLHTEAGSSMDNVIEMTTYHVGLQEHIGTFMKVKDKYVKEPYPAWTAIGITELAIPGGLVEIRVIAAN